MMMMIEENRWDGLNGWMDGWLGAEEGRQKCNEEEKEACVAGVVGRSSLAAHAKPQPAQSHCSDSHSFALPIRCRGWCEISSSSLSLFSSFGSA